MNMFLTIITLIGSLISLFAGRRLYPVWLGFITFLFTQRIFEIVLFRSSDVVHKVGSLAAAILVAGMVILLRERVIKIVLALGGFLVSAMIAGWILGFIYLEAGKFLFIAVLVAGGLVGIFLFSKLLDFDNAVILLSAVWGAGLFSELLIDILDILLISGAGPIGGLLKGTLDTTLLIQIVLWFILCLIGIAVQRKLGYEPIPWAEKEEQAEEPLASKSTSRRSWVIGILVGVLFACVLAAVFVGTNSKMSKSVRSAIINLERSLGMEAEAPGDAPWRWATASIRPKIELNEDDRILVLVPHPDDDILSTAGTIQQALEKGIPVRVVFFTNGDFNETSFALYRKNVSLDPVNALRLGETRREEATIAQGILGVKPEQIVFLGYPDGGGLEIIEKHWGDGEPYRAMLSGENSIPYTFAQSPGVPFKGESILIDLKQVVRDFQPTKIFTSHPGDVHPDHQTLPLYLQVALWDLEDEISPRVYHFITHYGRWPQPRGFQPEHPLEPPTQFDVGNRWRILPLTPEQREVKLQALKAHETQWGSGQAYLESVVRANELFDVIDEIQLTEDQPVVDLLVEAIASGEALALYPEDYQQAFVDTGIRAVYLQGDELVFTVEFAQPLNGDVSATAGIMGYSTNTPFGKMPKFFIDFSGTDYSVYDRGLPIPPESITVIDTPLHSEVRVPLDLMGDPEIVMVAVYTHLDDVPLDNFPWAFLKLGNE
jgi:LmbE family N-acetylglucosaminyl deacetylase